jgi:hypothetical protein
VSALVPSDDLPWTPIPLRTWFWVAYVCLLVAGAISLEVSLHYSHKKRGTTSILGIDNTTRFLIFMQGGRLLIRRTRRRVFFTMYMYVDASMNRSPCFTGPSFVYIDSSRGWRGYDSDWFLGMDRCRSKAFASELFT